MSKPAFYTRQMSHVALGEAKLLACLEVAPDQAMAFFKTGVATDRFAKAETGRLAMMRSVGNGAIAHLEGFANQPALAVDGQAYDLPLTAPELSLFEGLNCFLAVRNGETVESTLTWLRVHAETQNLQAALIIDRAKPGQDEAYLEALEAGISNIKGLKTVLVLRADVALGQLDLPPEQHPFNAPDAPGKDRMDVPAAEPWSSPLGELQLFELMRYWFLAKARAVALLDISDVLSGDKGKAVKGKTVFDKAEKSLTGSINLVGLHCYPWRVRNNDDVSFGDHICVQFDATQARRRWCVAPAKAKPDAVWRLIRVVGTRPANDEWVKFYRFMGLRHPGDSVSKIVPKTSLIEDDELRKMSRKLFGHKALRMPELDAPKADLSNNEVAIITCMKNEGPFILEWLAYHRAIGVNRFIVYTNDCNDGTDTFLDLLQDKGLLQHRDNPFKGTGLKPQHAALQAGEKEEIIKDADWVISMDVDEFINVKTGDGTLKALFDAVPDANLISCTWRLFGNSDVHEYSDTPLIEQFTRCALEMTRKPHQAWGFKTLYRNIGLFKKLGVHRPKGLNPQLWSHINWVNGSGKPLPRDMYRNAWRSTTSTIGYDMVQLNHYAVRSAESFLVKRDRGRVNHVDRDQGMAYWFRMNNNVDEDTSIQRMIPAMQAEMDALLADPEIAEAHAYSVDKHRAKIDALKQTSNYAQFYEDLTSARQERLARMHPYFGANVFLAGPEVIPDWVWERKDLPEDFFFTVEKQETAH
ncbi:glycosyltransferase family 2 protein [Shimia haliotis]|uniref:Glycosyl transferase family 2 n=1 Tax=Shimia haliotis TaxID=1280847 RepID=A0A1I4GDV3_9RHOB|nr:glycosyltransferase family 2 protein [Shimia haliotis]SFL28185.1 Glycosyl transferase family 2 [Shimia haliotis]